MIRTIIFVPLTLILISSFLSGCLQWESTGGSNGVIVEKYPVQTNQDEINETMISTFKSEINTVVDKYSIYFHESLNYYDWTNEIYYDHYYGLIYNGIHSIVLFYNQSMNNINISVSFTPVTEDETTAFSIIAASTSESYLMVPTTCEQKEGSIYTVGYHDGWDHGCGHSSFGYAEVDITLRTYILTIHVE